jgi:serine/threonine protein phosphatase PrpC
MSDPLVGEPTLALDVRAHSEVGPVRRNNQDSAYVSSTMLMVADGMGGAAAGDLASSVAVAELKRADGPHSPAEMLEVLAGAMNRANDKLADLIAWDHSLDGMGTTVCGAMFGQGILQMVHIGDSRGYLLRDGEFTRLTHDDSWVQSLVDEGKITEAEAAVHPHRSLLLKVLNGQPTHDPDYPTLKARAGDRLLFCSDGLCGLVDDPQMRQIITGTPLDAAVANLVDAAHAAGGYDNITVVLADVVARDPAVDGAKPQTSVQPQTLGAAATMKIPNPPPAGSQNPTTVTAAVDDPADHGDTKATTAAVLDTEDDEAARYAPRTTRRRRRWPWLTAIVVAVVLVGGGLFGAYRYVTTQYYIAPAGDQVAIYKGLPDTILGVTLGDQVEQRSTQISDLPSYYADQVRGRSIHAGSLAQAQVQAGYLDEVASTCIATRGDRASQASANPTASATPSVSASTPQASGSLGGPINTQDCP